MSGASRQTSAEKGILRIDDASTGEATAQNRTEGSPPHPLVIEVERYGHVATEILSHRAVMLSAVMEERKYEPAIPGRDDTWAPSRI